MWKPTNAQTMPNGADSEEYRHIHTGNAVLPVNERLPSEVFASARLRNPGELKMKAPQNGGEVRSSNGGVNNLPRVRDIELESPRSVANLEKK
jgi:hypothetical protein